MKQVGKIGETLAQNDKKTAVPNETAAQNLSD
jgi:hypothetical protein